MSCSQSTFLPSERCAWFWGQRVRVTLSQLGHSHASYTPGPLTACTGTRSPPSLCGLWRPRLGSAPSAAGTGLLSAGHLTPRGPPAALSWAASSPASVPITRGTKSQGHSGWKPRFFLEPLSPSSRPLHCDRPPSPGPSRSVLSSAPSAQGPPRPLLLVQPRALPAAAWPVLLPPLDCAPSFPSHPRTLTLLGLKSGLTFIFKLNTHTHIDYLFPKPVFSRGLRPPGLLGLHLPVRREDAGLVQASWLRVCLRI